VIGRVLSEPSGSVARLLAALTAAD